MIKEAQNKQEKDIIGRYIGRLTHVCFHANLSCFQVQKVNALQEVSARSWTIRSVLSKG